MKRHDPIFISAQRHETRVSPRKKKLLHFLRVYGHSTLLECTKSGEHEAVLPACRQIPLLSLARPPRKRQHDPSDGSPRYPIPAAVLPIGTENPKTIAQ